MSSPPVKIGITGTHSTGKSSFFEALEAELKQLNLRVCRIGDFAIKAEALGFRILRDHTFESTLWIMAECMRLEAEASLSSDVILVDRPVLDALGYLRAALELTGRTIGERRQAALTAMVAAHMPDYDVFIKTSLDPRIELGAGRDKDSDFRKAAARWIEQLAYVLAPVPLTLTSSNQAEILRTVIDRVATRLSASK
ncbi:AAA family ATPase [Bradyrhizobium lupini]|uniref:AAA family ATPase n=1 Tax=Rhizobium lupini TaxID=136996 RepID=UPI0034C5EB3E